MMTAVKSRRIASGGYVSGETARVEPSAFASEPEVEVEEPIEVPTFDYEAELTARVETARREMFEAGFQKGLIEGRKSVAVEAALLRKMVSELESGIDTVWNACQYGVARLGLQIGTQIVGEAGLQHETLAIDLAKRGILLAREQTEVTIFVNPVDLAALQAVETDILGAGEGVRRIEIRAKASIAPGGVLIECELGTFDLRPEVQLEAIEKALELEPESDALMTAEHGD